MSKLERLKDSLDVERALVDEAHSNGVGYNKDAYEAEYAAYDVYCDELEKQREETK